MLLINFHGSSEICLMGFIYSIQNWEICHQTFWPSLGKCPTCRMIFVNTDIFIIFCIDICPLSKSVWCMACCQVLVNSLILCRLTSVNCKWQIVIYYSGARIGCSAAKLQSWQELITSWDCFDIDMQSYHNGKSQYEDRMIMILSYLPNGIGYTGQAIL